MDARGRKPLAALSNTAHQPSQGSNESPACLSRQTWVNGGDEPQPWLSEPPSQNCLETDAAKVISALEAGVSLLPVRNASQLELHCAEELARWLSRPPVRLLLQSPALDQQHGPFTTSSSPASSSGAAGSGRELDLARSPSAGAAQPPAVLEAAWQQCEVLQRQLQERDAQLQQVFEVLEAVQHDQSLRELPSPSAAGGSLQPLAAGQQETAGQQLARFLKEQLESRDDEARRAQAEAERLRQVLEGAQAELDGSRAECGALRQSLAAAGAEAQEARAEAAELREQNIALQQQVQRVEGEADSTAQAQLEAEGQVRRLQRELWALEAHANLAAYGTPAPGEAQEGSISLGHLHTNFQSALGRSDHSDGADSPVSDVFGSPQLAVFSRAQVRQSQEASAAAREASSGGRPLQTILSFDLHGPQGTDSQHLGQQGGQDNDASSVADTADTLSEAAEAVRSAPAIHRALVQEREQLQHQVHQLSTELRELRRQQQQQQSASGAQQRLPLKQPGSQVQMLEQSRLHAAEERHLRTEIDGLNSKCDKANETLLKANQAMKILHYKLQKERKTVARLQDEKFALQAQLLSGGNPGAQQQVAGLLQELQEGRRRVEGLIQQRAALQARLEALQQGGGASAQQDAAILATSHQLAGQQVAQAQEEVQHARQELAAERARALALQEERAALEGRLQEVLGRLGAAEQLASQAEQAAALLQADQQRCIVLAAQLEREQAEAVHLSEVAQSSTAELMQAREEAHAERARAVQLSHDKAELGGRVAALQETLQQVERADNVLLALTEDKASLQVQLRDARAASDAAERETVDLKQRCGELEVAHLALQQQLEAALEQQGAAQAAVGLAADQLQQLSESHVALVRELEQAALEMAAAQQELSLRGEAVGRLEQQVVSLEAQAQQLWAKGDALAHHAQHHQQQALVAQQAALGMEQQGKAEAQRLEEAQAERAQLEAALRAAHAEVERLREGMAALQAECNAVQRLSTQVDGTNRSLVDSLIDAVQTLQHRNRLLQHDLDALTARHTDLQHVHDELAKARSALTRALEVAQQEATAGWAAAQEAQQAEREARGGQAELEAELAALRRRQAELASQLEGLQHERGKLLEQVSEQKGVAEGARAEVDRQQQEVRQQVQLVQQETQAAAAERMQWQAEREELQAQVAALKKSLGVAEGKLVLARQREAHFKEASKQLRLLKGELEAYLDEGEAQKTKRKEAEERVAELEAQCLELEQQVQQQAEQLAAAEEEHVALADAHSALEQELAGSRLALAQTDEQLSTAQSLQARLSELEFEQTSSKEWFDALSGELADKADQVAALTLEVGELRKHHSVTASELEAACRELAEATVAKQVAEAGWQGAQAELERVGRAVTEAAEHLQAANAQLADRDGQLAERDSQLAERDSHLAEATAGRELAEELAAGQAETAGAAQERCAALEQQLVDVAAAHEAAVASLEKQVAGLQAQLAVVLEQHRSTTAELVQHVRDADKQRDEEEARSHESLAVLGAQLEEAAAARQAAEQRTSELQARLSEQAERAERQEAELVETAQQLAAARREQEAVAARLERAEGEAGLQARQVEMLESQCTLLRQQLDYMHGQGRDGCEEAAVLRAELAAAQTALAELHQLPGRLAAAEEVGQAALARVAELQAMLTAREADLDTARQEAAATRQQLAVLESMQEHHQQEVEAAEQEVAQWRQRAESAAGEREQLLARAQVGVVLEGLSSRLQEQLELLHRLDAAVRAPLLAGTDAAFPAELVWEQGSTAPGQEMVERRGLLLQAVERLEGLKAENQQLWRMLEGHLSAGEGASGCVGGGGRPNRYVQALEGERDQLAIQLEAAQQEQGVVDARLAAAQAAGGRLQQVYQQRLDGGEAGPAAAPAAGGSWSASAGWGDDGGVATPSAQPQAEPAASQGGSTISDFESWHAEKRLLKGIVKLALGVTMDQVSGRQEAGALAYELHPQMHENAALLQHLGLHKVWASLHKLALAGRTASRAASVQQQQAAASGGEVAALQQRVEHYREKARALKEQCVALEGAAGRWQAQANEVEHALVLMRFRLSDLLSEIHWAAEDYGAADGSSEAGEQASTTHAMGLVVDALARGVRRLLRRHRALAARLTEGQQLLMYHPPQQQHQQQQKGRTQPAASSGEGGRASEAWDDGAAGFATTTTTTQQQMAEASRKAASIAQKIDRLLTPHSRAAVRSTNLNGACISRFAGAGAATAGHGHVEEDDEIPLRQRYGSLALSSGSNHEPHVF